MRDFLAPAAKLILAIIIAGAVINEIGAVLWAQYQGNEIARTIADGAATQYRATHSQPLAGQTAVALGVDRGITVYGFKIDKGRLTVWIKVPPRRTPLVAFTEWLGSYWDVAKGWSDGLNAALTVDTDCSTDVPYV